LISFDKKGLLSIDFGIKQKSIMIQLKKIKLLLFFLILLSLAFSQYDYSLEDLNSSSSSYGEEIGTTYFQNHVTLHYFGHFT